MARYNYNVDTSRKFIDVHKQFNGGLKTVDTDDALGAVFLRDAENVSLSEFGFIEKRYGTFEKQNVTRNGKLQAYFEFMPNDTLYRIYFVDGFVFVNDQSNYYIGDYEDILKEKESWRYPTTFVDKYPFQNERDINGVQIGDVLYIFTGTYPIYAKEVEGTLKFYWFSVDIPSYDEIVVVGHNLLEEDYEEAYGFTGTYDRITANDNTEEADPFTPLEAYNFYVNKENWYPQFPYVNNDGKLNFQFAYNYENYTFNGTYDFELLVKELSFAPAGSLASDVFQKANSSSYTQTIINTNATGSNKQIFGPTKTLSNLDTSGTNFVKFDIFLEAGKSYKVSLFNNGSDISYTWPSGFTFAYLQEDGIYKAFPEFELNGDYYFYLPEEDWIFEGSQRFSIILSTTPQWIVDYDSIKIRELYTLKPRDADFGVTTLDVELSNLITGFWDFKFIFEIKRLSNTQIITSKEVTYYVKNVNITPEKLQDTPGSEGVAVSPKAVWTCNRVKEHFGKLMVWGSEEMPNSLFYSFPDRPTYFPQNFYLDIGQDTGSPLEAVSNYQNILVAQTADATFGIKGNSGLLTAPAPYTLFTINPTVGALAWKSVRPVRNHLFFLSKQGIIALKSLYAADEQYNIEFLDRNIRNIVPLDSDAVGIQYDNQYWLNFPNYGITLRYYIDKKAWVKDTYKAWNDFNGIHQWRLEGGDLFFVTRPSVLEDGENAAIYKIGIDEALPSDLGNVFKTEFETSFLNQNYPFHPKNYKEVKLDFTLQNEYLGIKDPLTVSNKVYTNEVYTFSTPLEPNHTYRISFDRGLFSEAPADAYEGTYQIYTSAPTLTITGFASAIEVTLEDGDIVFIAPNGVSSISALTLTVPLETVQGVEKEDDFEIYDVTYDSVIDFKMLPVSETELLIREDIQGYVIDKETIVGDLGARFGDVDFGVSKFGDVVTAVKTNKISGRGYNIKIYFEDESKLKWTLESLGITFKMRRARSR
jgi:hypothetical protein